MLVCIPGRGELEGFLWGGVRHYHEDKRDVEGKNRRNMVSAQIAKRGMSAAKKMPFPQLWKPPILPRRLQKRDAFSSRTTQKEGGQQGKGRFGSKKKRGGWDYSKKLCEAETLCSYPQRKTAIRFNRGRATSCPQEKG